MKHIKLDAIDSTNDFLKKLSASQELENFTLVTAENQTKGKGQMGAVWSSEKSKNLIMSVFVKDLQLDIKEIYKLNIVTALAVVAVLGMHKIPGLSIKWPNDIMSANYKIAGILIENNINSSGVVSSVIGIGLNVNQTNFINLPKASSMAMISNTIYDKEQIALSIVEELKVYLGFLGSNSQYLWDEYFKKLFKNAVPMAFKDSSDKVFMGMIRGVTPLGKLIVQLENDNIVEYAVKEIQMLY